MRKRKTSTPESEFFDLEIKYETFTMSRDKMASVGGLLKPHQDFAQH